MKNRGFVLIITFIMFFTFLTSCRFTTTQVKNVDKPTAERQGSDQVVNVDVEKSESNTYGSKDDDISRSSNTVQDGKWIYFGVYTENNTGWDIYRRSFNEEDKKSLVVSSARGFCISGSLIFYIDFVSGGIYKVNKDGTGKTNILENGAGKLVVSKDWIYYNNINDNGHIYRISKDGSKRVKITEDGSWNFDVIHGDWIYYIKNEGTSDIYQVFRIGMDGREKSPINNRKASNLMILKDWIYYTDIMSTSIYKIRINGSDEMLINKEDTCQVELLKASGDWIYYYTYGNSALSKTYKIRTNGKNKTLIGQPFEVLDSHNIGISGDWIYAKSLLHEYHTYKLSMSETYDKKTNIGNIRMMNAVTKDSWVYYINLDDNCSLYRIKEDGTFNEKLHNGTVKDFKIDSGMVYFNILTSDSDQNGIYSLNPDSKDVKRICRIDGGVFDVENNFIYYCPYSVNEIYKIGIDGNNKKRIIDKGSENITVTGDWIYFIDSKDIIERVKIDGTRNTILANTITSSHPISIVEDWIYYTNVKFEICRIKTDGSSNEMVYRPASGAIDIYGVKDGWIYYTVNADKEFEYNLYKVFWSNPKEILLSESGINWINSTEGTIHYGERKIMENVILMKIDCTERKIIE